jgi:hypothetical protein
LFSHTFHQQWQYKVQQLKNKRQMKKIKISELPLYQSLKGLFVMGTDVNNRSVKVNLEFIESETTKAVKDADTATAAAKSATDKVLDTLGKIVPTGLFVESVPRLTLGNVNPVYLKAVLSPDTALKNLIYISDNRAVEVGLDGRISILNKGVSRVHIIPTCNTALARTVLIEVGEPTLRLVTTRRQMRFTQSGALRMN